MDAGSTRELMKPFLTSEQEEWLARVEKIAPLLQENRDKGEHDRVTPEPVLAALRDSGITRMWVSEHFGGGQVSIETGITVLAALARIDASVAWQAGVQGAIGRLSDFLSEEIARELFVDNTKLVVGGVKPFGRAEPVKGGYLLQGEWSFASGIMHAGWLICMAFVTKNGKPIITSDGPEIRVLFIRREQAEVLDTWYAGGLRGTGSHHYRVPETFVSEEYTVGKAEMQQEPAERPSRAYRLSYYDFGPFTVAPIPLGIAQDALESFKELATQKVPASGSTKLVDSQVVQEKLGRAEMKVYSSHVLLADAARLASTLGSAAGDSLNVLTRLTGATVAENTIAAVDSVYELAGSSSVYATSRLDRCFRDIHAATKHIALSSSHFETSGQYLLGGALLMRR
jgi:alkylation response protein AidB-like acyl-CoA dehydrogenase